MHEISSRSANAKPGLILHGARCYDFLVRLYMLGREDRFRDKILQLAEIGPGESVLDAGCGTGTLAIRAKGIVGSAGVVAGIDASPDMIARARKKAARAGADVQFSVAAVQDMPFPDSSFDVALSTLMIHHLPRPGRLELVREAARVLRPGGRLLIVDFGLPGRRRKKGRMLGRLHAGHGYTKPDEVAELVKGAGFNVVGQGPLGIRSFHFVLGLAHG